jgi:hypothetical protein
MHLRAVLDYVAVSSTMASRRRCAKLLLRAAAEKGRAGRKRDLPAACHHGEAGGYAADGRVNAKGVMRARYDNGTGLRPPPDAKPMQFKRRRPIT